MAAPKVMAMSATCWGSTDSPFPAFDENKKGPKAYASGPRNRLLGASFSVWLAATDGTARRGGGHSPDNNNSNTPGVPRATWGSESQDPARPVNCALPGSRSN